MRAGRNPEEAVGTYTAGRPVLGYPSRMHPLAGRVLAALGRDALAPPGTRIAVALSGGADSVALTLLLGQVAAAGGCVLSGVAHLNHQLRKEAAADQQFCRDFARRLGLPIEVASADVRDRAARERISIEAAGHQERYAFFRRAQEALDADCMATAHTRDDQTETVLMRLLRGAGPGGLAGIHPRAGTVIRPLLDVSHGELRAFLAARGQPFREDATNRDCGVTRNRVRHELIPFLVRRFSGAAVDTVARTADIARHDAAWLDAAAARAEPAVCTVAEDGITIDREALARQPVALARRMIRQALERVAGRACTFARIERVRTLAHPAAAGTLSLDLAGCHVRRLPDRVVVLPRRPRKRTQPPPAFAYRLPIPGEVAVPEAGVALSVERVPADAPLPALTVRGHHVYVDGAQLTNPLVVRNWQPGDALRPLGLHGRKKLQDLFVDRKVIRTARMRVPLVTDRQHGIVWIVGHAIDEAFRAHAGDEGMLILKARSLGEIE